MTDREYHLDYSADSHSSLQLFRSSVERYAAIRVHRTMEPAKPSKSMILGKALHCSVLEPDKYLERFILKPDRENRKAEDKVWWKWFKSDCEKKEIEILEADDYEKIPAMAAGIARNRDAFRLLQAATSREEPVYWTHESGVRLKCRPDVNLKEGIITDIKTTSHGIDPESVARTIANFSYYRQAALYLDGVVGSLAFVFVFVDMEPPHECACYEIGQASLDLGRADNEETIAELAERRTSGDWTGRHSNGITVVELPPWKLKRTWGMAS